MKAVTTIASCVRGHLTRKLMKTNYVQDHISSIKETLNLVLNLSDHGGSPVQNILLKSKLFRQLQRDLYNFNDLFTKSSKKEQINIIAVDREIKLKKQAEDNQMNLSLSFRDVV